MTKKKKQEKAGPLENKGETLTDSIKKTNKQILEDIKYGRSVSLEFFKNNIWFLLIIIALLLSLMGLRYKTKTKMAEIQTLEKQLQQAESSKLQEKSAYMSLIRESEMKRLVSEKGLGLEFQEQPPYELTLSE